MDAGAERRREDLRKLERMCDRSGGRLTLVSRNGDPPTDLSIELACRTAQSHVYPAHSVRLSRADITFPVRYPFQPPVIYVRPVTFHPNVYASGLVCLGAMWMPTETLDLLVRRIAQILTFDAAVVNTNSAANPVAARWYLDTVARFPESFPTDSLAFLDAAASAPKLQWRDFTAEPQQPARRTMQCEKCRQQLRVPDVPGTEVRCPRCLHTFRVAA
jgi:ubiquitin-protein ligase